MEDPKPVFFIMIFGKDQEPLIDQYLVELQDEVISVVKDDGLLSEGKGGMDVIQYRIKFRTCFGPYLLGHKQGSASAEKLFNILANNTPNGKRTK